MKLPVGVRIIILNFAVFGAFNGYRAIVWLLQPEPVSNSPAQEALKILPHSAGPLQGGLAVCFLALAGGLAMREDMARVATARLAGLYAAVLVLKVAFPLFLMNAVLSSLPSHRSLPRAVWSLILVQLILCAVIAFYLTSSEVNAAFQRDRTLERFDPKTDPMPPPQKSVRRNYSDGV